jgi:hypothetical protein
MNVKSVLDLLLGYVPQQYRRFVPLAGLAVIVLLSLFGARYLPPDVVAEVKGAVQTAIAPTVTP